MSTPLTNYTGAVEPDTGEANPLASSQVAGGATSIAKAVDTHNHTAGKGLPVPFSGLEADNDLDVDSNAVLGVTYLTLVPVVAGGVPNRSLFVDDADERLKYRDDTGTVRTITWTP